MTAALSVPPLAHTTQSLDNWTGAFQRQVMREDISIELLAEWIDMAQRHPCYFRNKCPRHLHTTARIPIPYRGSVEQWLPLVMTYFQAVDIPWAMRVMSCESGGSPTAKNPGSSASGLFQHLARYWPSRSVAAGWAGASIWDPEANIAVAAWLFYTGGRSHWVCK